MKKLISLLSAVLAVCAATTSTSASAQNVAAGEKKVAMCIGCHGIPGYKASFPELHQVPKISGQNAGYIAAALKAYRVGERKHPTMDSIAASLSDDDIQNIAAYYEQHGKGVAQAPHAPAEPSARVKEILAKQACASCHGADFNKTLTGDYPKLAGQHADYLSVALKAYQTEGNPRVGRANGIMVGMAKGLSKQDIQELAQYFASLPGDVKTVPQSRTRR